MFDGYPVTCPLLLGVYKPLVLHSDLLLSKQLYKLSIVDDLNGLELSKQCLRS